jgi:NTE family protein
MPLRDVGLLVLTPSLSLQALALEHHERLPRSLRALLGQSGGSDEAGAALLSYLLFDADYCRALINLGYRDGLAARADIEAFLR